ncbi:FkbM family methyltransferase [Luteibacter sp. 9133]|uniref:FkbM family methyltransferase n=1 Tax=Luteibacter sp. 9133 TaxID=1500891 RepID=UPI0006917388|nr:FkbM family methyltransferase [Luteibacter sp. 9133]
MTFISYAQNFEDVMLYRALKHVQRGVYVDVGAQHPIVDSVTKAFSLMGWRGINVEPVQRWFELLVADRPNDINLQVAVGADGEATIFDVEGTGLSTLDPHLAQRYIAEGRAVSEHRVRTVPLDNIFPSLEADDIHFLKIDCEGAERAVLKSGSFDAVRPWIIVVEATAPNSRVNTADQWETLLADSGYLRAHHDGLNIYFVAKEHASLLDAFTLPPNVFDDFIRANEAEALKRADSAEHRAQKLDVEVRSLRSNVDDISRRYAAEREAKLEALAGLAELRHDMQRQVGRLSSELSARDDFIAAILQSTSWRISAPIRAAKAVARRVGRLSWRLVGPAVVRAARAARPLLRNVLEIPSIRSVAKRLFGPETRIGRRARLFILGTVRSADDPAPLAMTEGAEAIEKILRAAIGRRTR